MQTPCHVNATALPQVFAFLLPKSEYNWLGLSEWAMCKICTLLSSDSSPSANTLPMCLVIIESSRWNNWAICSCVSHIIHSPANQTGLKTLLDPVTLPKKGQWSASNEARETSEAFVVARKAHSAVESGGPDADYGGQLKPWRLLLFATGFARLINIAKRREAC
jgi:hypothetical protein